MRQLVVLGWLVLLPRLAAAEESAFAPRLELAPGAHVLLATGDICEREALDLVTCSSKGFTGLELGLRGRVLRRWSFGLGGAYDWAGWHDGITTTQAEAQVQERLWRLGVDGRWHLRGDQRLDPYLELAIGIARSWNAYDGSEPSPGTTAPSFGAAVGFDFALLRHSSLGTRFGAQVLAFERQSLTEQRESGSVFSGPGTLWWLAITLTGRWFL